MKIKAYDVVVCGAGVAGVAAAIAAARLKLKTALIEKQCLLGGLATSGLIYVYLPLCDGNGTQLTAGFSEEMIRRCTEYGPFDVPALWGGPEGGYPGIGGKRFQCGFSPAGFALTLDKMLEEADVDLWLDTTIIDARKEGKRLRSVVVVNSSGTLRIDGACFVDTTGGAFVTRFAGGRVHRTNNFITPWFLEMADDNSYFHFTRELHIQCAGGLKPEYGIPDCATGKKVTAMVRRTWRMIRERYDALPEGGIKTNYPVNLPAMPQLRKIAHVDSLYHLKDEDHERHFHDSIGVAADWRRPDPGWETPYRALIPGDVDGLLAAGRCIGTSGDAWEIYRVIPAAVMTGEAAGTAAALSVQSGRLPHELDVRLLQQQLETQHCKLFRNAGPQPGSCPE